MQAGLGGLLGPLFGTVFYEIGGYKAPFFVMGSSFLLLVII